MKLKSVKRLGLALQIILLLTIGILFDLERMNALGLEIGLVVVMLGISMGLLYVSDRVDEERRREGKKARLRE